MVTGLLWMFNLVTVTIAASVEGHRLRREPNPLSFSSAFEIEGIRGSIVSYLTAPDIFGMRAVSKTLRLGVDDVRPEFSVGICNLLYQPLSYKPRLPYRYIPTIDAHDPKYNTKCNYSCTSSSRSILFPDARISESFQQALKRHGSLKVLVTSQTIHDLTLELWDRFSIIELNVGGLETGDMHLLSKFHGFLYDVVLGSQRFKPAGSLQPVTSEHLVPFLGAARIIKRISIMTKSELYDWLPFADKTENVYTNCNLTDAEASTLMSIVERKRAGRQTFTWIVGSPDQLEEAFLPTALPDVSGFDSRTFILNLNQIIETDIFAKSDMIEQLVIRSPASFNLDDLLRHASTALGETLTDLYFQLRPNVIMDGSTLSAHSLGLLKSCSRVILSFFDNHEHTDLTFLESFPALKDLEIRYSGVVPLITLPGRLGVNKFFSDPEIQYTGQTEFTADRVHLSLYTRNLHFRNTQFLHIDRIAPMDPLIHSLPPTLISLELTFPSENPELQFLKDHAYSLPFALITHALT